MQDKALSISIVTYHPAHEVLKKTVSSLAAAVQQIKRVELYIIDNGNDFPQEMPEYILLSGIKVSLISGHGNIGYGAGHNMAIARCNSDYHLVLNPDVEMAQDAILQAVSFLCSNPDCGVLAPAATDASSHPLYLCKRYPNLFDLVLRGINSTLMNNLFSARLGSYELQEETDTGATIWGPPIISGCFMFFRTSVLKQLGGFDQRFFLYFEDFDISLRAAELTRIAYVPDIRIIHHGGKAAQKGVQHILLFISSAIKFFNKHGWKIC